MSKLRFQHLLTPALLLGMFLTLGFVYRYEEPYPAIYQPAFQRASPQTDRLYTQVATVTAQTTDGKQIDLDYEDLFPFAPGNRDAFLFRMLPDTVPQYTNEKRPGTLKNVVITQYQDRLQNKRAEEYGAMQDYLKQRAEAYLGQGIIALEFKLYGVDYQISTDRTERSVEVTKKIIF